jgi:hypothetical protein
VAEELRLGPITRGEAEERSGEERHAWRLVHDACQEKAQ